VRAAWQPTTLGVALICAMVCFGALAPLWLYTISPGVDVSGWAALAGANRTGLVFGRDLIFTGGPLSSVYTHYFDPRTAWWLVGTNAAIAVTVGYFAAGLCRTNFLTAAPLIIAIAFSTIDALFMLVPFAAVVGGKPSSHCDRLALIIAAATTAALTLAKFSIMPIAAMCFVITDIAARGHGLRQL